MAMSARARPRRKCALPWFQSETQECAKKWIFSDWPMLRLLRIFAAQRNFGGVLAQDRFVQAHVVVDHALGRVTLPGTVISKIGVGQAQFAVLVQLFDLARQVQRVVVAEVDRRLAPDLAKTGDVVGDDGATGKRSFQWRQPEGFVARGRGVDRGAAEELRHLALRQEAFEVDMASLR